jgi:hypothetical protein
VESIFSRKREHNFPEDTLYSSSLQECDSISKEYTSAYGDNLALHLSKTLTGTPVIASAAKQSRGKYGETSNKIFFFSRDCFAALAMTFWIMCYHLKMRLNLIALFLGFSSILCAASVPSGIEMSSPDAPSEKEQTVSKRILGFGAGAGMPQLAGGEAFIYALPSLQIGASYGLAPNVGPFAPTLSIEESTQKTATGHALRIWPRFHARWAAITPYIRYFPAPTNFYIQLGLSLFSTYIKFYSGLSDESGIPFPNAYIDGEARVTQYLPTLTIGHLFVHGIFFCNFALGGTFVLTSIDTSGSLGGSIPDALGGTAANSALLSATQAQINGVIKEGITQFRREVPFLPSINVSIGFFL